MIRLYFYVEGATEAGFVQRVLRPHLAHFGVMVMATELVSTGRRHGQIRRGGGRHYRPARNELMRMLRRYKGGDVRFTTMFDLYGLYSDFPGRDDADKQRHIPRERVRAFEQSLADGLNDLRLVPYIQLHEFEAILFSDVKRFGLIYDDAAKGIDQLDAIASSVDSPELIDDGQHTAPSKRIGNVFPEYAKNKPRDGVAVAELIPLATIRGKCPHFNDWLTKLERLGSQGD